MISLTGERVVHAVHLRFPATNNVAEYEALLAGVWVSHALGVTSMTIHADSQLVGEFTPTEDMASGMPHPGEVPNFQS